MFENKIIIPCEFDNTIELIIYGEKIHEETVFEKADAIENGEATFQIIEGCYYEYKITNGYYIKNPEVVSQSKINISSGRISPNIYVGTLLLDVCKVDTEQSIGKINLEVQSVKTTYREDYRHMLEEITEKCTDLLLQSNSPVSQFFEPDHEADVETLYQRFAFINSIINTTEFDDAVHKIIVSPVTKWKESETIKDIRNIKRFTSGMLRQISSSANRINLPENHSLKESGIYSVPAKLKVNFKSETVDTPENRFIKHALVTFQSFCSEFLAKLNDNNRIKLEATLLENKLAQYLNHSVFKEVSTLTALPLNSPVLQRKEGYREVLRVWLMFDLAGKITWQGGEDVYSVNKRDVAVLYEYWLFFKLLDVLKEVFDIDAVAVSNLIEQTKDGLGLKLKQGDFLPVKGVYSTGTRKLNIEFSYNRTFKGNAEYPAAGSWTRNLRPDYTLTIWPDGITQEEAETEELIVHIHFDAKYKIENLQSIFGIDENLEEKNLTNEKTEEKKGTYKKADILKMHTYRDAIRRTAGAYVLYPGTENDKKSGFHEILPGLGAFAIRPSRENTGTEELKKFLNEIVKHFMNRASQREKISLKTYETYKGDKNEVNDDLPETYGLNRSLIPDETFVLIAFYKNDKPQLDWILKNKLYNTRTGSGKKSLILDPKATGAKYILLYTNKETRSGKIFKVNSSGPQVYAKESLIDYPDASQDFYLVYTIDEAEKEFQNKLWDLTQLPNFPTNSKYPFAISLTELMSTLIK